MMQWFGEDWGAPVCAPSNHVPVPIGMKCQLCDCFIAADDQGFLIPNLDAARQRLPWHRDCLAWSIGIRQRTR
jgi:hypothetical protein